MALTKPASTKATKKRKVVDQDPSQNKLDRYLSSNSSPSSSFQQSIKDDPMRIDLQPQIQIKEEEQEHNQAPLTVNVSSLLGTFRQQSLIPCIAIANANPERTKELPESFFKSSWETQKTLVVGILSNNTSLNINYVTASKLSESLCRYGKSQEIYDLLKQELENHVKDMKTKLLSIPVNQGILIRLNASWNTFCTQLAIIRNVFMELDRSFILPNTKSNSLIQLGKSIFSNTIMESSQFRNVVVAEVLNLIKLDRDKKEVDIKLIQAILQMMIELSYYSVDFEPKFLTSTNTYYKDESNQLIDGLSIPDYIQHAYNRRTEESEKRIKSYLDIHTKQALTNVVTNQLVYSKTEIIIKKGFSEMMDNNMTEPLKIFYELLTQSPKINLLRNAFGEYIKVQGVALIQNSNLDANMVVSLLRFKHKLDKILKDCFGNNVSFQNALKESFEHFINTRSNKPAELLAKFIDSKVKTSPKRQKKNANGSKTSSVEVDMAILDSALVLFRYIQGKDAFEAYYKRFLAKRLLLDRSSSHDIETHILEKLKLECGHEYTKNLESMFNDIKISKELNKEFDEFERGIPRMPLHVKVISQAIWPTSPTSNILLPPKMLESQMLYEKFYKARFDGRELVWQNSLSSCSLIAHFPKGNKELLLNLSQAVILLLFNDKSKKSITFGEMLAATNLNEKDLGRIVVSLSTAAYNIIINETSSGGDMIKRTDRFRYNERFENANPKLRIPAAKLEEAIEETKGVEEKVFQNRQHQLDAAIVRIMKSKKTLTHTALVNEIVTQVNYPVDVTDIKKRIESLIDKDYLSRDTEDSSIYIYQS